MKELQILKQEISELRAILKKLRLNIALNLAYYFWRFATKRNPELGYTCLDALHKIYFAQQKEQKETLTKPLPEPKQA